MTSFINYLIYLNQRAKKNYDRYHDDLHRHRARIDLTKCYEDLNVIKLAVKPFKFPKWYEMGWDSIKDISGSIKALHKFVHQDNTRKVHLAFEWIDTELGIMKDGPHSSDFKEIHYEKLAN